MMEFKAHKLVVELMLAINHYEWKKANELVEELQKVLATYKESC